MEDNKIGSAGISSVVVSNVGNYRWVICGLLFFATTVNYMDRQVVGYLKEFYCKPSALGGFGWTNSQFAYLTASFTGVYSAASIFTGRFIDKIGTKLGLALSLIAWSVVGILNAFVGGPGSGAHCHSEPVRCQRVSQLPGVQQNCCRVVSET